MLVIPDFVCWLLLALVAILAADLIRRAIKNRKNLYRAAPQAAFGLAIAIATFLTYRHTYNAILVEDDAKDGCRAERMYTIFEPDHPEEWVYGRKNPTWMFNRCSRSIYLELLDKGPVLIDPTEIKPGDVLVDQYIEHLGPDRPPRPARGSVLWLHWSR